MTRSKSLVDLPDPCRERELDGLAGRSYWWWRSRRLERTGPVFLQLGNSYVYRLRDLEAWLDSRRADSAAPLRIAGGERR